MSQIWDWHQDWLTASRNVTLTLTFDFDFGCEHSYCHLSVTGHGVWLDNWIYWTPIHHFQTITTLSLIYLPLHNNYSIQKSSVCYSVDARRCYAAVANNGDFSRPTTNCHCSLVAHECYPPISTTDFKFMLRPTVSRPVPFGVVVTSGAYNQIFITVRHLRSSCCGAPSLTRGRICNLLVQFAVILGSKSRRIHDYILLSHLRLPQPGGPGPHIYMVVQIYPRELGSLFVSSYDSQGYGGGILSRLHTVVTSDSSHWLSLYIYIYVYIHFFQ
jgi:hypothetical protein